MKITREEKVKVIADRIRYNDNTVSPTKLAEFLLSEVI